MTERELSILLIGSTRRSEFREARAVLDRQGRVTLALDVTAALIALDTGRVVPDVIVVAQAFPSQFSSEGIDRVRRLAPLAPVVGLLGTWCEGELRTGRPWPGAIRVYWHQWPAQCELELGRLRRDEPSSWTLPITAGDEERLLATAERTWPRREGTIFVRSMQFDMQDWLAAACRARGYRTEWLRPGQFDERQNAAAMIFEVSDMIEPELQELRQRTATLPDMPVIAVADFPRAEDRDQLQAAGATVVLSKPLRVDDLYWQLDQVGSR